MENTVTGIYVLLICLLAAALVIWWQNRSNRTFVRNRLKSTWGKIPDREYTYEELHHISQFFRQREKQGFFIDDITWNDLDMDRVFILLNQNASGVGADGLYDLLRKPVFDQEKLSERNRLMEYFRTHQAEREQVQLLLSAIKKPGNVGVYEAVHAAKNVSVHGKGIQILHFAAFLASLLIFAVRPNPGIFVFLTVAVVNIASYLVKKGEIDIFLTSFRCVLQLLQAQKQLEKLGLSELKAYEEQGRVYKKALSGFRRGSSLVMDRSSMGGGLDALFMDYVRMLTHVDLIKFNEMMDSLQKNQKEIEGLIELFGYLDALLSIASFREALPYYSIPQLLPETEAEMETEDLYHPLITNPVANSICAKGGILVTGSNASGKSTFLKNIAINAILAQTVYTCTAALYRASFFKVMTSMALRDDLESGESYYIVEIRSLKRILEEAEKQGNLLCIIDEVLRGTNTIERIGASSQILGSLCRKNVLVFAATHDIELSYILEKRYQNYHFEEEVGERDVVFNYLLKEGRVSTRNAIRLLEMIGYKKELVARAKQAVEFFEEQGVWKNMGEEPENCR